jgi:hypothetical protein
MKEVKKMRSNAINLIVAIKDLPKSTKLKIKEFDIESEISISENINSILLGLMLFYNKHHVPKVNYSNYNKNSRNEIYEYNKEFAHIGAIWVGGFYIYCNHYGDLNKLDIRNINSKFWKSDFSIVTETTKISKGYFVIKSNSEIIYFTNNYKIKIKARPIFLPNGIDVDISNIIFGVLSPFIKEEYYSTNLIQSAVEEFIKSNYKDEWYYETFKIINDKSFIDLHSYILDYDYKSAKALLKILEQQGKIKFSQRFSLNKNAAIEL